MADLVLTGPGGDRVVATCPGDTPVFDSPEIWVTAEFLMSPVYPFTVEFSDRVDPDGCPNASGTLVKVPKMNRVWQLTGEMNAPRNMFHLRWPD
jgi:hypothetical protein